MTNRSTVFILNMGNYSSTAAFINIKSQQIKKLRSRVGFKTISELTGLN